MKQYREAFFKWKRMRPTTVEQMREALDSFFEFNGDNPITASNIMSWINSKNDKRISQGKNVLTTASKKHYVILLSSYCKYLIVTDRLEINPCEKVRLSIGKASAEEVKPQWALNIAQIKQLFKVIQNPRDKAIIMTFLKTGCREQELCNLNVEDIDFDNKTIALINRKFGKTTLNPIDNELIFCLKEWLKWRGKAQDNSLFPSYKGTRLTPGRIYSLIKAIAEKADIKDLHPHIFRHTFTTLLTKCNPYIVDSLRGDKPTTMRGHYTHHTFQEIQQEYEAKMPILL